MMKLLAASLLAALLSAPFAHAKLPPPSPEAKAAADEAKLKTAWSDKVAAFQLCRSMDRVVEGYFKSAKAGGKPTQPPLATPPCTDPGPFALAKPLEASGAHSPPATAATPPSTNATQAETQGAKK
jgi:hypothetical protein